MITVIREDADAQPVEKTPLDSRVLALCEALPLQCLHDLSCCSYDLFGPPQLPAVVADLELLIRAADPVLAAQLIRVRWLATLCRRYGQGLVFTPFDDCD